MGNTILCYSFPLWFAWTWVLCPCKNVQEIKVRKCIWIPLCIGSTCLHWSKMYHPAVLSRACNFDTCLIFSMVKHREVVLFWCTWMFHAAGVYELPSHPLQWGKLSELYMQGKSRGQRGWSNLPWGHLLNLPWWGAGGDLDHWMELWYALLYELNILFVVFAVHI